MWWCCAVDSHQRLAQLSVDAVAEGMTDVFGLKPAHLVGPNWSVNCSEDEALYRDLQSVLGGPAGC